MEMKPLQSLLSRFLALLAGLFIFVGLPLLGWDIRAWSRFFENPARTAYVIIILILQLFAITYNPRVGRHQEKRRSGVASHKIDLFLIQLFSLAVVFLAPFSDRYAFASMQWGDRGRYGGIVTFLIIFKMSPLKMPAGLMKKGDTY